MVAGQCRLRSMSASLKVDYKASRTISRFHRDDSFVRALMGPFGSGKSVGCVMEILMRAADQKPGEDGVRRSRWAAVRNSYRELKDTTIETFNQWVPAPLRQHRASDMATTVRWPGVECEVLFRALDSPDDVGKLLSLELTGAWLNEAREIPKAIFDAIQGRVGRFPTAGGGSWFGVILDTNPPDTDHWMYRVFEEQRPAGHKIWHQPSGVSHSAENIAHLPPGYYDRLKEGKDQAWVDVYVHGKYGFVRDGKPIYPEYEDSVHCAAEPIQVVRSLPLIIGLDFGLTPAAAICQDVSGQWRTLDELVTEDMGALRFGQQLGMLLRGPKYQGMETHMWGDPTGDNRAQTDETTPFQILEGIGLSAMPAPSNDPVLRREAIANRMSRLDRGRPAFLISPTCKILRKGLMGGYKYRRLKVSGDEKYHDVPDKNMYSHVCEAQQYAALGEGEGYSLIGAAHSSDWDVELNVNIGVI